MTPAAVPCGRVSDPDDLALATLRIARARDRMGDVRIEPCDRLDPDEVDARLAALAAELAVHGLAGPGRG